MKTATIAGLGIQGAAIAYALHILEYEVKAVEISDSNIETASKLLDDLDVPVSVVQDDITVNFPSDKPDILISALPFHLNYDLALRCIDNGVRYCDLGGNNTVSEKICNAAINAGTEFPVMPDLGLAPGIANIIAEIGYRKVGSADTLKIRVGGLPVHPKGTLKYGMTFNPQGLYNEYHEKCLMLRDGEVITVDPLTEIEKLHFDGVGELAAFNTSGGIANLLDTMSERGVKNCNYKTIRFPGHAELIRFMLVECGMSQETFSDAVLNACGYITDDQVLMAIEVSDTESGNSWTMQSRVLHDDNFTAMQKTTGFGTAAVAAILGQGVMDGKPVAKYADVPSDDFIRNMNVLIPELNIAVHQP